MTLFWKMLLLCSFAILSHNVVFGRPAAKMFPADLTSWKGQSSSPVPGWSWSSIPNMNNGAPQKSHSTWSTHGSSEFDGGKGGLSKNGGELDDRSEPDENQFSSHSEIQHVDYTNYMSGESSGANGPKQNHNRKHNDDHKHSKHATSGEKGQGGEKNGGRVLGETLGHDGLISQMGGGGDMWGGVSDVDILGDIPDADMSGQIPDADMLGQMSDVDMLGQMPDADMLGQMSDVDMLGQMPDVDMLGQMPDADMLGQMPDADMLEQMPDADMLGQMPDADMLGQMPDADMLGQMLNADMFGQMPDADMFGQMLDAEKWADIVPVDMLADIVPVDMFADIVPVDMLADIVPVDMLVGMPDVVMGAVEALTDTLGLEILDDLLGLADVANVAGKVAELLSGELIKLRCVDVKVCPLEGCIGFNFTIKVEIVGIAGCYWDTYFDIYIQKTLTGCYEFTFDSCECIFDDMTFTGMAAMATPAKDVAKMGCIIFDIAVTLVNTAMSTAGGVAVVAGGVLDGFIGLCLHTKKSRQHHHITDDLNEGQQEFVSDGEMVNPDWNEGQEGWDNEGQEGWDNEGQEGWDYDLYESETEYVMTSGSDPEDYSAVDYSGIQESYENTEGSVSDSQEDNKAKETIIISEGDSNMEMLEPEQKQSGGYVIYEDSVWEQSGGYPNNEGQGLVSNDDGWTTLSN